MKYIYINTVVAHGIQYTVKQDSIPSASILVKDPGTEYDDGQPVGVLEGVMGYEGIGIKQIHQRLAKVSIS